MPRNPGAQVKVFCVVAALAALLAACGEDGPVAAEAGMTPPPKDAAPEDATVEDSGTDSSVVDASDPPWSEPDSSIIDNVMDEYCALHVAAECDGAEDCPGGACCARFEPSKVAFTSMRCEESCDLSNNSLTLCHEGDVCTADGQFTCRTSVLIPHDFIGICAPRTPLIILRPPTGEAVKATIDCGSQQCVVGEEQCCLRAGFNVRRAQPIKYEPFCAPIGEPCECTGVDTPPRDSGMPDDEDAGL
jgi:hypothetical protein